MDSLSLLATLPLMGLWSIHPFQSPQHSRYTLLESSSHHQRRLRITWSPPVASLTIRRRVQGDQLVVCAAHVARAGNHGDTIRHCLLPCLRTLAAEAPTSGNNVLAASMGGTESIVGWILVWEIVTRDVDWESVYESS